MAFFITVNRIMCQVAEVISYDDLVGLAYHGNKINFLPTIAFWVIGDPAIRGTMVPGDRIVIQSGMYFKVAPPVT